VGVPLDAEHRLPISTTPPNASDEVGCPDLLSTRARRAVARAQPAPRTAHPRRTRALGAHVPPRREPVGPTGHRPGRISADPRPDPDGILRGSRSGFLVGLAAFYGVFAGIRNRPGLTPTSRLKWWENWL